MHHTFLIWCLLVSIEVLTCISLNDCYAQQVTDNPALKYIFILKPIDNFVPKSDHVKI